MEKQTKKYSYIQKFKAELATEHQNFERQLKEVKKKYPLVALAYALQEATIAELSLPKEISSTIVGSMYTSLTESLKQENLDALLVEMNARIRKLKVCFMRARSSADGKACVEDFIS